VELASDEERRHAHRALATLFEDKPERQAWHLAEATGAPDEGVAAQLEQAAYRSLRRGDPVGAVNALTRAARLSPDSSERGRRLGHAAYIGAAVTGELGNVSALLVEAAQVQSSKGASLETVAAAAYVLLIGDGDIDTAHGLLVEAIEHRVRGETEYNISLDRALYTLLMVCFFGGRADLWGPLERALERLGPSAPLTVDVRAKTQGNPIANAGEALPQLDTSIGNLAHETDPTQVIRTATASSFVDRLPRCRQALWRVVRDGRAGGALAAAIGGLILLGLDDYWTGQWDEAEELSIEAEGLCQTHGYTLFAPSAQQVQALVAGARGDYSRARAVTDAMLEWAAARRMRSVQLAAWHARALTALGRGDFEDAYQEAHKITQPGVLESHNPYILWSALDLAEAASRTGRHSELALHARALQSAHIGTISPRLALVECATAAIAAPDTSSISLFAEALAIPGADQWPFDLARVQLACGERLRRLRASRESRVHLNAALQTFDRLGATPWSTRTANEIRATGQVSHQLRDLHRESLTAQEREIAELAAAGLTNKEIGQRLYLSHRTVSGHLHRIFPKLAITSRAALRDALASLDDQQER
jgi:DNA-binding CsgD family transcriptional regulator